MLKVLQILRIASPLVETNETYLGAYICVKCEVHKNMERTQEEVEMFKSEVHRYRSRKVRAVSDFIDSVIRSGKVRTAALPVAGTLYNAHGHRSEK
ncbi:hypothetical protein PoB_001118800 [Plakobranchus ocellatus]|uniref:Uncharacterized protein n=1 Tax=Plakobranchus ocellatus TaxID=259542 RepID=A0AAV3YQY5_9GAST|nr:hypothetical protein PoB_001118800 [Plakobranchus ocellatus]